MVKIDLNQFRLGKKKYIFNFKAQFDTFFNQGFLQNYLNKQFLLTRNFLTQENQIFSWHELNLLIEHHRREYPRWSIVRHKKFVSPKEFMIYEKDGETDKGYKVDLIKVQNFIRKGCTLVFNNAEISSEPIRDLSLVISQYFREDVLVNIYASFGEDTGFGSHYDKMDTLIFQLEGQKYWKIYNENKKFMPLGNHKCDDLCSSKEVLWEGFINKGDLFYIPAGTWHEVSPVNTPSLHLTFSIYNRTALNYIDWLYEKIKQEIDIDFYLPKFETNSKKQEYETDLHQQIIKTIQTSSLNQFLNKFEQRIFHLAKLSLPYGGMTFEQLKSTYISDDNFIYDTGYNSDLTDLDQNLLEITNSKKNEIYQKILILIKQNTSYTIGELYNQIQNEISKEHFDLIIKIMLFKKIIGIY